MPTQDSIRGSPWLQRRNLWHPLRTFADSLGPVGTQESAYRQTCCSRAVPSKLVRNHWSCNHASLLRPKVRPTADGSTSPSFDSYQLTGTHQRCSEKYCDLRTVRWFRPASHPNQGQVNTKHYPSLLLNRNAQRREMPELPWRSQAQAVTEWLLAMFDAGTDFQGHPKDVGLYGTYRLNKWAANRPGSPPVRPAPTDIIIRNPDGEPTRVSWLDTNRGTHAP